MTDDDAMRLMWRLPEPAPLPHAPAAFDIPPIARRGENVTRYFSIPWVPLPAPRQHGDTRVQR